MIIACTVKRKPSVSVDGMDTCWVAIQKITESLGSCIMMAYIPMNRKPSSIINDIQSAVMPFVASIPIKQKLHDLKCCIVTASMVKRKHAHAVNDMDTSWVKIQKISESLGSCIFTFYTQMDREQSIVISDIQSTVMPFVSIEMSKQKLNDFQRSTIATRPVQWKQSMIVGDMHSI